MPYARTGDRVRIYYEEHGPAPSDVPKAEGRPINAGGPRRRDQMVNPTPPLVLAYGIGGNTDMWDTNTAGLAARHRVILWEPRGHARSDSPEDPAKYSFARWACDLRDLRP